MVKSARLGAAEQANRRFYRIEAIYDANRIRQLLEPRRIFAAYAVGQLSPDLFSLVDSWRSNGLDDGAAAFVLFSRGGLGNALFTMGDPAALDPVLALHPGPRQNYVTCEPHHLDTMRRHFRLSYELPMLRMAVSRSTFVGPEPLGAAITVRRMLPDDARPVNRLYNTEGSPTYYSGQQIASGAYFGVFEDGRLVSVAGTHVVSPEEGIAVVGNVFTHPRFRGFGYARLATSATTAYLLRQCRDVVLTVDATNSPAVRAYLRIGYKTDCRLIEAGVTRRQVVPWRSYFKRLRARFRAREEGIEIAGR